MIANSGRSKFRKWVEAANMPDAKSLPLTHIAKGIIAYDIIENGKVSTNECPIFRRPLVYFFYGRPAYKVTKDKSINLEASCPFCFVFASEIITHASAIYPFDTGAFANRMFNNILDDAFQVEDFNMGCGEEVPEKLISVSYKSQLDYINGDRSKLWPIDSVAPAYELAARSYLTLISSQGRNEPDDRIATIEVQFETAVDISPNLLAIIVPHTQWQDHEKSPDLARLHGEGVEILSYEFIPGRPVDYYQSLSEIVLKNYYKTNGLM